MKSTKKSSSRTSKNTACSVPERDLGSKSYCDKLSSDSSAEFFKARFEIDPVPASRPRVLRYGKPYYLPTYEAFRREMAMRMGKYTGGHTLYGGPLRAFIVFHKLIPVSLSKKKREAMDGTYCVSNVDLDNMEKAIYDAMNGNVYLDDSQIVEHTTCKRWTMENPRIEVLIKPI